MVNNKLGLSIVFITSLLSGCSTTSSPMSQSLQAPSPTPQSSAINEREQMLASLNLTATQQAQLQALRQQNRPNSQQIQSQLEQLNNSIHQQQQAQQTVQSRVDLLGLYQNKHALILQEAALHQQYEQKFLAILSPVQRIKYYQTLPENKK